MSDPENPSEPRLSLVVPIHNEEENILPFWKELVPVLDGLGMGWEALLVDDGSTDSGPAVLEEIRRGDPRARVVRIEPKQGQSAAFWAGFRRARGRIIVTLDADLQNDPADIPILLKALDVADVAVGWRQGRRDPLAKRIASRIANGVRNWITRESIHDVGCSLKAFRGEALGAIVPFHGMHRFFPTLVRMAGGRVVEVKVRHRPRTRGKSKYGIANRIVGPLADCLAVLWMKRRRIGEAHEREVGGGN